MGLIQVNKGVVVDDWETFTLTMDKAAFISLLLSMAAAIIEGTEQPLNEIPETGIAGILARDLDEMHPVPNLDTLDDMVKILYFGIPLIRELAKERLLHGEIDLCIKAFSRYQQFKTELVQNGAKKHGPNVPFGGFLPSFARIDWTEAVKELEKIKEHPF
jgi:hypothetical protein